MNQNDDPEKPLTRIEVKKYKRWKRDKSDFQKKYEFIYKGIETNTIYQAIFPSVVQIRKFFIVIIFTCFEGKGYLQLQLFSSISLVILCYVASTMPFQNKR